MTASLSPLKEPEKTVRGKKVGLWKLQFSAYSVNAQKLRTEKHQTKMRQVLNHYFKTHLGVFLSFRVTLTVYKIVHENDGEHSLRAEEHIVTSELCDEIT